MMKAHDKVDEKIFESFRKENSKDGIRVFVAGGSRSGNDPQYVDEAYNFGRKIIEMGFRLDFGLSNRGIMGAVAKGVLDGWDKKQHNSLPIQGITTQNYFKLYPSDDELIQKMDIVMASSLEERKQKLLKAYFVVFTPGGVGTLDELAYDCVAMQDGMLPMKPFIIYNVNGYFYHLLEFLKSMAHEGFADNVPFIVVDNAEELEIAFRLLKIRYIKCTDGQEAYVNSRKLTYELPYFIKQKIYYNMEVEKCVDRMAYVNVNGTDYERQILQDEIKTEYYEK